jgi:hypothetical protein
VIKSTPKTGRLLLVIHDDYLEKGDVRAERALIMRIGKCIQPERRLDRNKSYAPQNRKGMFADLIPRVNPRYVMILMGAPDPALSLLFQE